MGTTREPKLGSAVAAMRSALRYLDAGGHYDRHPDDECSPCAASRILAAAIDAGDAYLVRRLTSLLTDGEGE